MFIFSHIFVLESPEYIYCFNFVLLKCNTWNIDSLKKRKATLAQYFTRKMICVALWKSKLVLIMQNCELHILWPIIANPSTRDIYIKNSIPSKVTDKNRDNTCAEYFSIKIFVDGKPITIVNEYNPHDSDVVNLLTAWYLVIPSYCAGF